MKKDEIYEFLISFIKIKSFPHTIKEIAHAIKFKSLSSVCRHLEILKKDQCLIGNFPNVT
ncbi:hypothetical protein JJB63_15265 [Clostridium perfringens]|uniref:LexA family protein n=1 Tax=Clostridium perfringens TaxID=1502 RepID=UPI001A28CAAA|nr:hypothetical protein [Clostridium perfringens]MBO3326929.1 hypothetical protein [Clostridium perfringens]HAT4356445.1 hypothetical protein [Clostridium perfringens]